MTREQYFNKVREVTEKRHANCYVVPWDDPKWQNLLGEMYDDFAKMTPEEQQNLIKSAGPEQPFWERAVEDGAYAHYMW